MVLSDSKIKEEIKKGNIKISDFDESRLNPNSYNLRLGSELRIYDEKCLDMKKENKIKIIGISEEGYVLEPGKVYIASTIEYTETLGDLVPVLEGRSSIGRLGIFTHVTAGWGDTGFKGKWTLEIVATQPVRIYPEIEICQIVFHRVDGKVEHPYHGKYQNQQGAVASKSYKDFEPKKEENKGEENKNWLDEFFEEVGAMRENKPLLSMPLPSFIEPLIGRPAKVVNIKTRKSSKDFKDEKLHFEDNMVNTINGWFDKIKDSDDIIPLMYDDIYIPKEKEFDPDVTIQKILECVDYINTDPSEDISASVVLTLFDLLSKFDKSIKCIPFDRELFVKVFIENVNKQEKFLAPENINRFIINAVRKTALIETADNIISTTTKKEREKEDNKKSEDKIRALCKKKLNDEVIEELYFEIKKFTDGKGRIRKVLKPKFILGVHNAVNDPSTKGRDLKELIMTIHDYVVEREEFSSKIFNDINQKCESSVSYDDKIYEYILDKLTSFEKAIYNIYNKKDFIKNVYDIFNEELDSDTIQNTKEETLYAIMNKAIEKKQVKDFRNRLREYFKDYYTNDETKLDIIMDQIEYLIGFSYIWDSSSNKKKPNERYLDLYTYFIQIPESKLKSFCISDIINIARSLI